MGEAALAEAILVFGRQLFVLAKPGADMLLFFRRHLLKAADVSRVYLFECFEDPEDGLCVRQTFESVAPGIKPEINNPEITSTRTVLK